MHLFSPLWGAVKRITMKLLHILNKKKGNNCYFLRKFLFPEFEKKKSKLLYLFQKSKFHLDWYLDLTLKCFKGKI